MRRVLMHTSLSTALASRFMILGEVGRHLGQAPGPALAGDRLDQAVVFALGRAAGRGRGNGSSHRPAAPWPVALPCSKVTRPAYAPRAITEICYLCERCGSDTQAARRPPGRVATFHCPIHCP